MQMVVFSLLMHFAGGDHLSLWIAWLQARVKGSKRACIRRPVLLRTVVQLLYLSFRAASYPPN